MTTRTTILVPIRYPLTEQSTQTLAAAARLAQENASAELVVLHVNLFQTGDKTQTSEISHAIASILDGTTASVLTRRGFLVEEVILEEAAQSHADIIVVGANQRPTWRKVLSELTGNGLAVAAFLREHVNSNVEIIEVDSLTADVLTPAKDSADQRTENRPRVALTAELD
ncbi:universal stress protein [Haladaptatus sp. GCM10025707]|uniref:universal stress protein n=1 Tax=unclassified Haladaptatus TaxID=2622732 RepID=UPI0023E800B4|nr:MULTISPECIES: universal stress protein [unclassified Haladaptatus]